MDKEKTILFDTSHGETAGEADWIIDGGFSSFADALKSAGYNVKSTDAKAVITAELLQNASIFVLPEPNIPLKAAEQEVLKDFTARGGSILFISDHYNADRNFNRYDASEILNGYRRGAYHDPAKGMSAAEKASDMMKDVTSSDFLSDTFGVRFRYNAIDDVTLTDFDNEFNILDGVKQVQMHAGSTLAITNPERAKGLVYLPKLSAGDSWEHAVDQGIYNGGGKAEGPFIAISKPGKGKAAFIGDSSIVEDATPKYIREDNGQKKDTYDGFDEASHKQLLLNLINWLALEEDYTTFKGKIPLDDVTPLLKMEEPKLSTEPTVEPWAKPKPGYLWYDRSSYVPGSYGSTSSNGSKTQKLTDKAEIIAPKEVHKSERIQIKVRTKDAQRVRIDITVDGKQMGLFSGRPPGPSDEYTGKRQNDYYESYYNGKIAREAYGTLIIRAYDGSAVIAEKKMTVLQ